MSRLGQSPWYDFITRDLVRSGELARLIHEDGLKGMTSNPTIFEKAVATSTLYDDDIQQLADAGQASPAEIFEALAVADVQAACDVFRPVFEQEPEWRRHRVARSVARLWRTTPKARCARRSGSGRRSIDPTS